MERIDPRALVLPDDRLSEMSVTIANGDDADDGLDILERVLAAAPEP